jgi:hypothetical protein
MGFVAASASATHTLAGWTNLGTVICYDNATTPAPVFKMSVFAVQWSAGLGSTATVALSAGSPGSADVMLLRNTDVSSLQMFGRYGYQPGAAYTVSAETAGAPFDLEVLFTGIWYGSGITGYSQALTGGSGWTEVADLVSTRAAGTNVGLGAWQRSTAVASGGTIASTTTTISGGTGSTGAVSYTSAVIGVARPPASHGPTQALIELAVTAQ